MMEDVRSSSRWVQGTEAEEGAAFLGLSFPTGDQSPKGPLWPSPSSESIPLEITPCSILRSPNTQRMETGQVGRRETLVGREQVSWDPQPSSRGTLRYGVLCPGQRARAGRLVVTPGGASLGEFHPGSQAL